jgi:alcohol dehydrogenase
MTEIETKAAALLREFKGETYEFGSGMLDTATGKLSAQMGKKALFVGPVESGWFDSYKDRIVASLQRSGVEIVGMAGSAAPNAPFVDVYRIHSHIVHRKPEIIVAAGGGSAIDAVKAAAVIASVGDIEPEIAPFFGVGAVSKVCTQARKGIIPVVAVMMTASSGAHLTKYSNITDPVAGQKKLIVDEAIVPPRAIFDYNATSSQPEALTFDGGLDGIAHCLEVYFGADEGVRGKAREIAEVGIDLIIGGLIRVKSDSSDSKARDMLGLGTDLGGYAIMVGGTSGAHLSSFSLVDVLSHGRACALMNPYYTVFFAPAIEEQLRVIGHIYKKYGYVDTDLEKLKGRDLGIAVAEGMLRLSEFLGFPVSLKQVPGMSEKHVARCLDAAKNPQLDMKLRNMPVPLHAGVVDEFMAPILEAAWDGDFSKIKSM